MNKKSKRINAKKEIFVIGLLLIPTYFVMSTFFVYSLSVDDWSYIVYDTIFLITTLLLYKHLFGLIYLPEEIVSGLKKAWKLDKGYEFFTPITKIYHISVAALILISLLVLHYIKFRTIFTGYAGWKLQGFFYKTNFVFIAIMIVSNLFLLPTIKLVFENNKTEKHIFKKVLATFAANMALQFALAFISICILIVMAIIFAASIGWGFG